MRRFVSVVALLLAAASAQARDLTPSELLDFGQKALLSGAPEKALASARALVGRDSADYAAQLLGAYAARDLGRLDEAKRFGLAAWRLAADDGQRHAAALAIAQAESSNGHRLRAQYWLRRAAGLAPDAASRAIAVRDYRYVRSRNPLILSAKLSITPSSNVNGGTNAQEVALGPVVLPVPAEMQALSGVEALVELDGARTVVESETRRDRIGLHLTSRSVRFDEDLAVAADYAYAALEGSYESRHQTRLGEVFGRVTFGANSFGGTGLSEYSRAELGWSRPVSGGRMLGAQIGYERQDRRDDARNDADVYTAKIDYEQGFSAGRLGVSLSGLSADSASISVDRHEVGGAASFVFAQPLWGAELALNGSIRARVYGYSAYTGGERRDLLRSFGAEAFLAERDVMGFAPVLGLTYSDTRSDAVLFGMEEVSFGLGLRSTF